MNKRISRTSTGVLLLQMLFQYAWLSHLRDTDSFYSVYVLCAFAGIFCMFDNARNPRELSRRTGVWLGVLSGLFSLATLLANYPLFQPVTSLLNLLNMALSLAGGFLITWNLLVCLASRLPLEPDSSERNHPGAFFWTVFGGIAAVNLLYLFFCCYPCIMAYDSFASFRQILGLAAYDNRMPYWFTRTIGFFFEIGCALFGEINAAVAFYTVFQVLFLSACFAYALLTLYQARVPRWFLGIAGFLYALLPYNLKFNVTIGKDVLFGVAGLLTITALYRILRGIGRSRIWNYVVFALGSLGFCLWRTNGWYAYLVTALVLLICLRRQYPRLLAVMAVLLVVCGSLLNPYFQAKDIAGTDYIEAIAIPFQQVAQVVANDRELSAQDEALLSESFDLELVKELYTPGHVDVIKYDALRNRAYFLEHLGEYFSLWLRLGLKYPGEYLTSWIDQTKGYWNSGYDVGVNDQGIAANELGIRQSGTDNLLSRLYAAAYRYVERPVILQFLKSSGFAAWVVVVCFLICALQGRREFLLSVPALVILAGLWFGTPVYAEFRYSYPVFITTPLLMGAALFGTKKRPAQPS